MDKEEKLKKIGSLLSKIKDKQKTNIGFASEILDYGLLDTPFPTVNSLIGGIPIARFTTVAGPYHTGKGAFCLQTIAHLQSKDPDFVVLWTDAENAIDLDWAKKLGVDLDRFVLHKYSLEEDTMEKVLDSALKIIKETRAINMWVIDSIGALVPKADIYDSKDNEKTLEGDKMLNLQRKLGEFFRKANVLICPRDDYKGCAVVCIGQIYTVPDAHGSLEQVKGGNAFAHWTHLRLMFRRGPKSDWPEPIDIMGLDGIIKKKHYPGWSGRIKVEKTRINANEGQEVLLTFMKGRGFDSKSAAISAAFGLNIIERTSASMYSSTLFPEGKIKGKENVINFFLKNEDSYNKLINLLNIKLQEDLEVMESNKTEEIDDNTTNNIPN